MKNELLWLVAFLPFLQACKPDKAPVPDSQASVYIINEGNFNFGTAEISAYDPDKKTITNSLFSAANGYSLGDVAQSMCVKDSLAFIVVNNSAKIEVVRLSDFKKLRTISISGSSPRYFLPVDESLAYVTDLYAGKVYVVNYQSGAVVKEITEANPWTEHLVKLGDYVFVEERNYTTNNATICSLIKLDAATNTYLQRFTLNGANLNGLVTDKQQHFWVAIEQDSAHNKPSALVCLNQNLSEVKRIEFAMGHHPSNLCINGAGDELYFFDNGVYRVSIDDVAAPATAFVNREGRNFYALAVNPVNEEVYVSDALDYVQSSIIFRYDSNGQLLDNFHAGVISGNFCFKP
ncbi:MAG: hypothetical protein U0V74_05740 [Chitinophagales bacterium]